MVDLVAEGFDAAIRAGPLKSSSMIAHRIVELRYLICASPSYLERRGTPMRPEDISEHDCIYWRVAAGGAAWSFVISGERVTVPIRGRLLISNFAAQREAARRDDWQFSPCSPCARIWRLAASFGTPEYEVSRRIVSLVRPPTPFEPPKLRAFIDFITAALGERARYDPR